MSINIRKIGITDLDVDCIVNAANSSLLKGGGVCGAIFREAGAWNMQRACDKYGYCPTGSAVITPGFKLRAKFVIHAVGPIWRGGSNGEEKQLFFERTSSLFGSRLGRWWVETQQPVL